MNRMQWHPGITLKYIVFLVFISILPLLLLGIVSHQVSSQALEKQASDYQVELLEAQKSNLLLQLTQVENLIANISGMEEIINSLAAPTGPGDRFTELSTKARIGYILNNYTNLDGLVSIDIFSVDGRHYHVGDTLDAAHIRVETRDALFRRALESDRLINWAGVQENVNFNSSHHYVITAAKLVRRVDRDTLQSQPLALIVVNYSTEYLYEQFSRINLGRSGYLLVTDQENRVIYHPDPTRIGMPLKADFGHQAKHQSANWSAVDQDGTPVVLNHLHLPELGWSLTSVVPVSTLTRGTRFITQATAIGLFIALFIMLLTALLYSRNVVRPIRTIIGSFKRFRSGALDLDARLEPPSRDEVGELVQWFNVFMETLAAQRHSEAALRESEERYSLAVRGANDGLWDWDLRTDMLYLSPRFKAMLGFTDEELGNIPDSWFGRIHPEDRGRVESELAAHMSGQRAHFESEHRLLHKDGVYRWLLGRGLAVRDAQGKAYRMAGSLTEITHRKTTEEQLRHDALHDPLTGLHNRAWFINRLDNSIERHKRRGEYLFAVMFLDLDGFKRINDSLGHEAGDHLLREVAQRLNESLRTVDAVARLGGDEFVILLEDLEEFQHIGVAADRILSLIAAPVTFQGKTMTTSASIGICLSSTDYSQPELMLRDADVAMYRAKNLGKNRYELFDVGMREQIVSRQGLESEIRRAIDAGEFLLHYQPVIELTSNRITGFEALLRWQHPERGLLSPESFLKVAEETGQLERMSHQVMVDACRQVKTWNDRYPLDPPLSVGINLSAKQVMDGSLVQQITETLWETEYEPRLLVLEVTENALMHESGSAAQVVSELKALGVSIHLDDFGTGYTSLSMLSQNQVDAVKIDRSLIAGLNLGRTETGMVRTSLLLAHELGLPVIAEGVESDSQADTLRKLGCDFGQGYYFSRPLSPQDAERYLSRSIDTRAADTGS